MTLPPRPREWQLTGLAGIRGPVEQVQAVEALPGPHFASGAGRPGRASTQPLCLQLPCPGPSLMWQRDGLSKFKVECVTPTSASSRGSPDLLT